MPLAANPEAPSDRALLIESLVRDRSTFYGYPYAAIRDGHFMYIRFDNGEEELYNLARDPYELQSLADDPAYAERKRSLAAALERASRLPRPGVRRQSPSGRGLSAPPVRFPATSEAKNGKVTPCVTKQKLMTFSERRRAAPAAPVAPARIAPSRRYRLGD